MQSSKVQPLLRLILEDLPCKKLSIVQTIDGYVLCGFKSKCSMIIQDLTRLIKPIQVYKAGEGNYIVVYSQSDVAAFIKSKFKELIRKLLPEYDCYYSNELGFVFHTKEDYDHFISSDEKVASVRKVGIDYGWTAPTVIVSEPMRYFGYSSSNFSPMYGFYPLVIHRKPDYWLNFCSDYEAIYRAIFPEVEHLKQDRMTRQSFLQAEHSPKSQVNKLINLSIQNKPVLGNIFSCLWKSIPKIEISVFKCEIENDPSKSNNLIIKIKELINKLIDETENTIDADKSSKIAFLKLILNFKETNPLFALKECLKLAEIYNPNLYETAIKGVFSRTEKLINKINGVPDKNKSVRISL